MRTLISSIVIFGTLANLGFADEDKATPAAKMIPRTITVSGKGKAAAPPDMATIRTGVVTTSPNAKDALAANSRAMEQIMKTLRKLNIKDKDMQTSGFSVYPEYRRQQGPRGGKSPTNEIIGYRVSNNVSVRVRNLPRLGEILDSLVQSGSNQVSGVQFSISEPKAITDQARKNAIDDAKGRAELYAVATGCRVGKVISISEQAIQSPRPQFERMAMMASDAMSVPVATGEQEVGASINVMYELLD